MESILFALFLLAMAGCAGLPTPEQVATTDYGSYPDNYENIVKDFYINNLKDPDSVKYKYISTPRQYWIGNRVEGAMFGYLVCVTVITVQ